MAVRKISGRWYPVGKKGKAWKTGFATEAKAKSAQSKANKYWGSKKTTKRKTPKKKNTSTKKKSKKKKNPGGKKMANAKKYAKNAMTPSNMAKMYAIGGAGIDRGLAVAEGAPIEELTNGIAKDYAGYDPGTGQMRLGDLIRGYGAVGTDIAWRKFAKAMGFKSYPASKPKNLSEFLDYLTMYGVPITTAYANRDNPREAHRQVYEQLYGIDLHTGGWNAFHPASMLATKGPYTVKKMLFKFARDAGYKIG